MLMRYTVLGFKARRKGFIKKRFRFPLPISSNTEAQEFLIIVAVEYNNAVSRHSVGY